MGTRVPVVEHYNLRSANSYVGNSLHDLNTDDIAGGGGRGGSDNVCRGGDDVTDDSLDNDEDSATVVTDCMRESFRNSLPLHGVGVEEDQTGLENSDSSTGTYIILTIDDISPIETARARFLDVIVDHFINPHIVEVSDSETDYSTQCSQDKLSKRRSRDVRYEGDARFVLPLMYVANMYETLVNEVNSRLSSLSGMREKSIGIALEAAGGLYRKLAKKFPRKGPCIFRRRELATSFETRSRFPELVIQEEKRVRFVVVNGLAIVEKPSNMRIDDAEWFKRLTGRTEAAVCARDYKFYAPRHKYRRVSSNSISMIPGLPTFSSSDGSPMVATQGYCSVNDNTQQTPSKQHIQSLSHQAQFHPLQQSHQHHIDPSQPAAHFSHNQQCGPPSHLTELSHAPQSSTIPQHMGCLPTLGHVGGRLQVLSTTSPAKFCDECGAPYLRETSKFCSECGTKRLGI